LSKGSSYLIPASKYPLLHHQRCEWPACAAACSDYENLAEKPTGRQGNEGWKPIDNLVELHIYVNSYIARRACLWLLMHRENRGSEAFCRHGVLQHVLDLCKQIRKAHVDCIQGFVLSNTDPRQRPESCPARPIVKSTEAGAIPATRYIQSEMGPAARNSVLYSCFAPARFCRFRISRDCTARFFRACLFIQVDC
jgi:hypothetical protein